MVLGDLQHACRSGVGGPLGGLASRRAEGEESRARHGVKVSRPDPAIQGKLGSLAHCHDETQESTVGVVGKGPKTRVARRGTAGSTRRGVAPHVLGAAQAFLAVCARRLMPSYTTHVSSCTRLRAEAKPELGQTILPRVGVMTMSKSKQQHQHQPA